MKRGFSLIELVVVLFVLSSLLILTLPSITALSAGGEKGFKNRLQSLLASRSLISREAQLCVDFTQNSISIGEDSVSLPEGELESLVIPGRVVSSENHSRFCFSVSSPITAGILAKSKEGYSAILFLFPVGEVNIINLSESEAETLKDKIAKGRITDWFSYYSF